MREHTDHLNKTWNLSYFISQIQMQIEQLQPDYQEMNQILISFKLKIIETTNGLRHLFDKVEKQVDQMLIKAKSKIDQDIDEIKTILNKLGKSNILEDYNEKSKDTSNSSSEADTVLRDRPQEPQGFPEEGVRGGVHPEDDRPDR